MRIIYSLPHPADKLASEQAGHTVRASAILAVLETLGHEVVRVEAAADQGTQTAVKAYRGVVKKLLPRPIAMRMRDMARVANSRRYAARLIEAIERSRPDVILETHIAFSLAGKIATEQTGVPLVLDDVAPSWEEEQQYGVGAKKLAHDTHREVTGQARMLVAVSESIRRFLVEEGLPDEKIVTISNGIDGQRFRPGVEGGARRAQYGLDPAAVVVVYVGSFQPFHRLDLLLEAFRRLQTDRAAHLLLVGGDKRLPEVKALAERLGLMDRVTFTGRVPYEDVPSYIAAGDIAVMPATGDYTNPMKVYEYMALGRAVLAPEQDNVVEIATHSQDAYLFARENVEALAAALKTLIEDAALRERLGQRAARLAADHTWLRRGEQMAEAIQEKVLGAAGSLNRQGAKKTS